MPAMPCEAEISNNNEAWAFQFDNGAKFKFPGITKREMFAMNAPQCPEWFIDEFRAKGDVELIYNPATGSHDKLSLKQRKRVWIEWRYAYADLMLED